MASTTPATRRLRVQPGVQVAVLPGECVVHHLHGHMGHAERLLGVGRAPGLHEHPALEGDLHLQRQRSGVGRRHAEQPRRGDYDAGRRGRPGQRQLGYHDPACAWSTRAGCTCVCAYDWLCLTLFWLVWVCVWVCNLSVVCLSVCVCVCVCVLCVYIYIYINI